MTIKKDFEYKKFGLSQRTRKAFGAAFLAGGLFGAQAAQAAVPTSDLQSRVTAVRVEMNKRVAESPRLGPLGADKLTPGQMQIASWLNWYNWPNWNNWRDWNNWRNWSNWANFLNY